MRATTRPSLTVLAVALAAASAGVLPQTTARAQSAGGHLVVLSSGDVDTLDPGAWYSQYDYMALGQTTQRWLYAWEPGRTRPTPDVAAGMPRTSADGKTVTIEIRPGIRYSAPLAGRTVTAADVAYALTRDLEPRTGNPYARAYYGDIVGAPAVLAGRTESLAGVAAPDATTLVIHLVRPSGAISNAQALALPGTIPVPEDYAARYDAGSRSTYGRHQVFTGPYVIASKPGRPIELARNPEWNGRETGDFRPAHLDSIAFDRGWDFGRASRKILTGTRMVSGDFTVAPPRLLRAAPRGQVVSRPAQLVGFIALNTRIRPFDNLDVRRAVAAVVDKRALLATRGGPRFGAVATHLLPPGIPGFEAAGGTAGPGFAFTRNPAGDVRLARAYLRKAGYRDGRYHGRRLWFVGAESSLDRQAARLVARELRRLGFRLRVRLVPFSAMLRFCARRQAGIAICPNVGWQKDFFDAQSFLDPLFNGANRASSVNYDYSQVDNPRINRELRRADALTDPAARARIYARVDRQVTGRAYVIPWIWQNDIVLRSRDVHGVVSRFNSTWDLTFTAVQ